MTREGVKLNEVTFGCLIDACIKCNQLSKAIELLEQQKSMPVNTIIYTTILKGFTKEKNFNKAQEIFNLML